MDLPENAKNIMSTFLHSYLFAIILTVGMYCAALLLQRRFGWVILNPILISCICIIIVLKLTHISYETYHKGGQFIEFLLKPAVVALGIPLYMQLEKIKKQTLLIFSSQLAGCIAGVFSVVLIAKYLGASFAVIISISPKSATTPIAIEVSRLLGGITSLTAIIVILTGVFGAIFGEMVLRIFQVNSRIARGLAMGAAAHAIGTSQAMQTSKKMGVYSSLGLIINGTLTGFLTPYLLEFLGYAR